MCVHEEHLINQGIHWCALQKENYPKCCNEDCPGFEEAPAFTITATITDDNEYFLETNDNEYFLELLDRAEQKIYKATKIQK